MQLPAHSITRDFWENSYYSAYTHNLSQIFKFDGFNGFKRIFPDVTGAPEPFTSKLDSTCALEDM